MATVHVQTDIRTCSLLVFSKGTSLSFVHGNVSEPLEIVKFVYPSEPCDETKECEHRETTQKLIPTKKFDV